MPKKVVKIMKLLIMGGAATPAPPLGPMLSQAGVNIKDFVDKFNQATQDKRGQKVTVVLKIYDDRSFTFEIKKPPASELIKKALGIKKGSGEPNIKKVGTLTRDQLRKIAEEKMEDLNTTDIEKAAKIIEGTARQMGVTIED